MSAVLAVGPAQHRAIADVAATGAPWKQAWRYCTLAAGILVAFVLVAGRPSAAVLVLVGSTLLTLACLLTRRGLNPVLLAVSAQLAILVGYPFAHLPHDRLTSYAVISCLGALTTVALLGRQAGQPPHGWVRVLALFLILGASSALSPDQGAVKQLVTIAAAAIPMFVLGSQLDRHDLPAVTLLLLTLAGVESLVAVAEPFLFPRHLWAAATRHAGGTPYVLHNTLLHGFRRSEATMGHPLPLGLLLVLALALAVRAPGWLSTRARIAGTGLLLTGLLFTGDRNALLMALAILVWGRRLRLARVAAAGAALVLCVGLAVDVGSVTATVLDRFTQSGSYLHRLAAYRGLRVLIYHQSAVRAFVGNGFASTPRVFSAGLLQRDGLQVVDNQFVLLQSQGGLSCLLLCLSLLASCVRRSAPELRVALVTVISIMLIFDSWLWPSATALSFLVFGMTLTRPAVQP